MEMKSGRSTSFGVMFYIVNIVLFFLYCYITFQNHIDLNELTIKFSFLYFITWILYILYFKNGWRFERKSLHFLTVFILTLQLVTICYEALTANTEQVEEMHKKIALMLGQSQDFADLQVTYKDIEKLNVQGDTRRGNFHYPFDFIVELKLIGESESYYFQCDDNLEYCDSLVMIENLKLK